MDFIEQHKEGLEALGFWTEQFTSMTITALEMQYKTEIIKAYCITEFVVKDEKTLIKWKKRFNPLTKQELKKKYGR